MWIAVMGLMMLTGAVVREQEQGFDDFGWRRGVEQATANESSSGGAAVTVIAGPPVGTVSMSGGDEADASTQSQLEGSWDLACESKRGNHMVFDRDSIREIGNATLFRWAAAGGAPESEDAVYTAVADKRMYKDKGERKARGAAKPEPGANPSAPLFAKIPQPVSDRTH